jgi:hypothetical protein
VALGTKKTLSKCIISLHDIAASLVSLCKGLDSIVFIIWIGVCLAPIFQEMNLFGVKLKQDTQDLKKDLTHQISIFKKEITSSIEVYSANNNKIYVNINQEPPKDSEIPDLSAQIKDATAKLGIKVDELEPLKKGTPRSIETEMFEVRLAFEKLLRRYSLSIGKDGRNVCGYTKHAKSRPPNILAQEPKLAYK